MAGLEWESEGDPGRGELRLVTVGEITRALHFPEASSLYIHYALYLPTGENVVSAGTLMDTACCQSRIRLLDTECCHQGTANNVRCVEDG